MKLVHIQAVPCIQPRFRSEFMTELRCLVHANFTRMSCLFVQVSIKRSSIIYSWGCCNVPQLRKQTQPPFTFKINPLLLSQVSHLIGVFSFFLISFVLSYFSTYIVYQGITDVSRWDRVSSYSRSHNWGSYDASDTTTSLSIRWDDLHLNWSETRILSHINASALHLCATWSTPLWYATAASPHLLVIYHFA